MKRSDIKVGMHVMNRAGAPMIVVTEADAFGYCEVQAFERYGSVKQTRAVSSLYPANEKASAAIKALAAKADAELRQRDAEAAAQEEVATVLTERGMDGDLRPPYRSHLGKGPITIADVKRALKVELSWPDLEKLINCYDELASAVSDLRDQFTDSQITEYPALRRAFKHGRAQARAEAKRVKEQAKAQAVIEAANGQANQ